MAVILTAGGAILFFVLGSANREAINLAMMLLGLMTYFIDHFAKERADIYYENISLFEPIKDWIDLNYFVI